MSHRISMAKALAEKLKEINGTEPYKSNLYSEAYPKLKFWDELSTFPAVYMSVGQEIREYLPGDFKWGYINISLKLYCKGDQSQEELEALLDDVETCIDTNRVLTYNDLGHETTDIMITSITTDEGLLAPYSVGEINLQVRFQVM